MSDLGYTILAYALGLGLPWAYAGILIWRGRPGRRPTSGERL